MRHWGMSAGAARGADGSSDLVRGHDGVHSGAAQAERHHRKHSSDTDGVDMEALHGQTELPRLEAPADNLEKGLGADLGSSSKPLHAPPTVWQQLWACVSYGLVSVSLTLTQKMVFHTYAFHFPNSVTLMQILCSLVLMHALRASGVVEFKSFDVSTGRKVFPLALMWWLYVVSGVCALRHLSVPMFSVLRRITTILVAVGEYLMFSKVPTPATVAGLLLMCSGAILAGLTDLTFNLTGYIYISVCILSTAMYLLLIKKLKDSTGLNEMSLLYYNNFLGLPMMVGWLALGTGELSTVFAYEHFYEPKFMFCMLLSASQAFLLNLCIFHCTSVNSPLATSVTGQIKDIATTGLGMMMFDDMIITATNMFGLAIGLIGGMVYSAVSYMNSVKAAKESKKNTVNSE